MVSEHRWLTLEKWHTYGILGSECLGISVCTAKKERGRQREKEIKESYTGVVYVA